MDAYQLVPFFGARYLKVLCSEFDLIDLSVNSLAYLVILPTYPYYSPYMAMQNHIMYNFHMGDASCSQ